MKKTVRRPRPERGTIAPGMRLRLDPWAAEYDTAFFADDEEGRADGRVDVGLELPADAWRAVAPAEPPRERPHLLFLDGGRRVEARVLLEDERRQVAFGALGSYGVGAVRVRAGERAAFVLERDPVRRVCALSSGFEQPALVLEAAAGALGALRYEPVSTQERDPDAVVRAIQNEMRASEGRLAARLGAEHPDALILCDGPRPFLGAGDNVVGYVKTIHRLRVPSELLEVVRALEQGQRSPLYLIERDDPQHAVFEWFLRLRDPRPWLYSLAGMVRLQAHAGADPAARLEEARALADWSCTHLPPLASRAHQDPRAPQQLLPIRALEAELRRRMGHPQILRRRITRTLSAGAEA